MGKSDVTIYQIGWYVNFRDENHCQVNGIVRARAENDDHYCLIVEQDETTFQMVRLSK